MGERSGSRRLRWLRRGILEVCSSNFRGAFQDPEPEFLLPLVAPGGNWDDEPSSPMVVDEPSIPETLVEPSTPEELP
jgi:hypothetical protein